MCVSLMFSLYAVLYSQTVKKITSLWKKLQNRKNSLAFHQIIHALFKKVIDWSAKMRALVQISTKTLSTPCSSVASLRHFIRICTSPVCQIMYLIDFRIRGSISNKLIAFICLWFTVEVILTRTQTDTNF